MPIDIRHTSAQDISNIGKKLYRDLRNDNMIFESTAQAICETLYETFGSDGDSTFALVRVFRLCKYDDLPPDIKPAVNKRTGHHWMTLAGTAGDDETWWDRHNSVDHKAVSAEEGRAPMFTAAFEQIGLNPQQKDTMPGDLQFEPGQMKMTRFFFVENADNHPAITDQERFVQPYDIQSVVALGSPFLSGSSYIAIAFSKVALSVNDAEKWTELTPYISSLLAIPDGKEKFWR